MMRINLRPLLYGLAITAIVLAGITLRIGPHIDFSHVGEGNLSAYYFDKFNRIASTGKLVAVDIWEFAPDTNPENVPPGLPYVAAGVFAFAKLIFPGLTPIEFAPWVPVFVYLLFGLTTFALFSRREKSMLTAVTLLSVITLAPIFASYTEYAYFTQEPLGAWFLFLSAYFIAHHRRSRADRTLAIASVTALVLTWQQFPIFYLAAFALAAAALVMKRFSDAEALAVILVAGLVLAEFISRVVIGIHYSAFGMLKEIALGAMLFRQGNPDFLTAMTNIDWHRGTIGKFYRWYGPLTALLFVSGTILSWLKRRDFRYLASFVFGIAAIAAIWQFQKERIFGFGLLLLPIGMGALAFEKGEYAIDWQAIKQRKRVLGAAAVVFAIGAIGFVYGPKLIDRFFVPPPPVPDVTLERRDNSDGTIDLTVRLTNRGGTTYAKRGIFWNLNTGLHLAVENADILEYEARSPLKRYEWYPYHVYPYIRLGNIRFLETRYRQLKNGEWGDARVKIRPTGEDPARFYYRGWLTDVGCTNEFMRKSSAGLIAQFDPGLEDCVIRFPAHDAADYPACPIAIASRRVSGSEKSGQFGLKPLSCAVINL